MLEFLSNVLSGAIDWFLTIAIWGFVVALGFLTLVVVAAMLAPFARFIVLMYRLSVDLIRIARGKRPWYNPDVDY